MKRFVIILLLLSGLFCNSVSAATIPWKKEVQEKAVDPVTEQAKVLYAQNNIDAALDILQGKLVDDRSAEDWLLMGNILQDKDKLNEAVFMFNQAILKDPKYYKAHYNLGYIYMIKKTTLPDEQTNSHIILAAHSGNSYVSFFRNLKKLDMKDKVYFYYEGVKYIYEVCNKYVICKGEKIK